MTRLYLWAVCVVVLSGCRKEPSKVDYYKGPLSWTTTNTVIQSILITNHTYTIKDWIADNYTNGELIAVWSDDQENWLITRHGSPNSTTFQSTHRPTISQSNNIWLIRFEP